MPRWRETSSARNQRNFDLLGLLIEQLLVLDPQCELSLNRPIEEYPDQLRAGFIAFQNDPVGNCRQR